MFSSRNGWTRVLFLPRFANSLILFELRIDMNRPNEGQTPRRIRLKMRRSLKVGTVNIIRNYSRYSTRRLWRETTNIINMERTE